MQYWTIQCMTRTIRIDLIHTHIYKYIFFRSLPVDSLWGKMTDGLRFVCVCDFVAFKTLNTRDRVWARVNHFVVTQNEAIFVYQNSLKHTLRPDKSVWCDFRLRTRANKETESMLLCFAENHYRFDFACACKRDCTKITHHSMSEWGERLKSLESAIVQ